ncbi:MAG TPA: MerR family transcriptional regulator [Telluria sp.]|nr:MerR family transcriptional regulator [Telluria sp.]
MAVTGVPLEAAALGLDEFARACAVEPEWVVRHVQAGVLGDLVEVQVTQWRFGSAELRRARSLLEIERTFEAGEELAGLVDDLILEVRRLRARIRALGLE